MTSSVANPVGQQTPTKLFEFILKSLRGRNLSLFCGAGISANSGMPTARELIDRIASALPSDAEDRPALCIENLPFEAFLQVLSEAAPLEPLTRIYRSGRPTAAHRLMAVLMRQGLVRSAFTTNFDLLIEQALRSEGMKRPRDYARLADLRDFAAFPDPHGRPQLVKVHGSIDRPGSIAATIRAVASRQVGTEQAGLLRALFSGPKSKVILIIGYSGSDRFDIMPQIAAIGEPRASIVLVTHIPGLDFSGALVRTSASFSDDHQWKSAGPVTEIQVDTDLFLEKLAGNLLGESYGLERRETRWRNRVDRWATELVGSSPTAGARILGRLFEEMGNIRRSAAYFDRGLNLGPQGGDLAAHSRLHKDRGRIANLTGDYREAIRHGRKALSGSRRSHDPAAEAGDLGNLGLAFYNLGRTQQAIKLHRRAWYLAKRASAEQIRANQLGNIGLAYRSIGRYRRSAACHALSVKLNGKLGSVRQQAAQLANLGLCCTYVGDLAAAEGFHEQALYLLQDVGDLRRVAVQKGSLGTLRQKQSDFVGALRLFREALAGARRADDLRSIINQLNRIAEIAIERGRPCRALIAAKRALTFAEQSGHLYSSGMTNVTVGRAHLALGDAIAADRHGAVALALLEGLVPPEHPYRRAAELLRTQSNVPVRSK